MQNIILKIIVTILVIAIYAIPIAMTKEVAKKSTTPKYFNEIRNGYIFFAGSLILWLLILIYLTWPLKF